FRITNHQSRITPSLSTRGQIPERIDRLAVVANLEVQHVACGAGAAHFRDLLAGGDPRAFVHQTRAVVPISGQPLFVVLDDDQFAIAHQARSRVHHHAVGGGAYRLPGIAGDADTLLRWITGDIASHHLPVGRPAPGERR